MNVLPGSSCGDCNLPDTVLGIDWLYAGGDPELIGQSLLAEPGELTAPSGLANSCGPGANVGLKGRSVMLFRLIAADCRAFRLHMRKRINPTSTKTAPQTPIANPAVAPESNLPDLPGAVSSYFRVKTCSVIIVIPEIVTLTAGTNV
jgi:hypothetical protein